MVSPEMFIVVVQIVFESITVVEGNESVTQMNTDQSLENTLEPKPKLE